MDFERLWCGLNKEDPVCLLQSLPIQTNIVLVLMLQRRCPYILLMTNGCVQRMFTGEEAGECLVEAAYLNVLLKRYHKAATYYRDAAEMYERCNLYGIDVISHTLPRYNF